MNLLAKQKKTHRLNKSVLGEGRGEGRVRECGINTYTLLYLRWITTVQHMELCSMSRGRLDGRGV